MIVAKLSGHKNKIQLPLRMAALSLFICTSIQSRAQQKTDSASSKEQTKQDTTRQLDLNDIAASLFSKHNKPRKDTAAEKPGKLHVSLVPAIGLTQQTGFAGIASANLAFYSEAAKEDKKISSISTSFTYSQYSQIIFPLQSDIWTKENRYNIITDWRYLKYPSTTFGLGGNSNINDGYTIDFDYAKIHQTVLKKIGQDWYAGLGYYFDYFWNVKQVNPPLGVITGFQKYGFTNTVTASGPALRVLYDSRQNQINPANGWYANIIYRPNFVFLGSDNNWASLLLEFRKYIKLRPSSKNVLAFWSYNWLTVGGKPPYLLLPSTGWDDFYNTGRGYIQGRFRGRNMVYLETEYRFQITANGLLGGVVFTNAESFTRIFSSIPSIAPAFGGGIRIKLNKFSGANLCIDYGIGLQGSKGIQVNLGEVF